MSLIFTPAQRPPKLDKFCYMSHPAQRVMSALYRDYLTRKRNLLQCLASSPPAQENYYQSIYKSRFGSVPKETHNESRLNVPEKTLSPGDPSLMDRNYYEDVILTAEEVADNQPNPRSSRNTADGHFSQLPLTGCNLTLSDSPPIETQGYRILSQFHHDKTDTLIFGDGLTNVQEKSVEARFETCGHISDNVKSKLSDKSLQNTGIDDCVISYFNVGGSQSLFSQDMERNAMPQVAGYIKRKSKKAHHTLESLKNHVSAEHLSSHQTMIEEYYKLASDKTTSDEQKFVNLTGKTKTILAECCHENTYSESEDNLVRIESIGAQDNTSCTINFHSAAKKDTTNQLEGTKTSIPNHLEKLKYLALSTAPLEDNAMLKDRDGQHAFIMNGRLSDGKETYHIDRVCASKAYRDIMDTGIGETHSPWSSDVRSGELQEKQESLKKRKTAAAFAAPFKKPKLPPTCQTQIFQEKKLIDTESLFMAEQEKLLSEFLLVEEVVIALIYKDGSTQLRDRLLGQRSTKKSVNKGKQSSAEVESLAIFTSFFHDRNVFTIPVKARDQNYETFREFWCQLLRSQVRKIGFHVIETLKVIMKVYKLDFSKVDTAWTVMDPLIGLWLLDPDKALTEFEAMLHFVDLPEQTPSADCIDILHEDMMLLQISMDKICEKLKARDMWDLFTEVETKVTTILAGMEMRSLHIATHTLLKFSEILKKKLKKLEQKAHQAAGHAFLLNSHAQLRQVLFEELCLDVKLPEATKVAKTNAGREKSTSETVLTQLSPFHELPGIILEYRQLQKLKSTYIDGILSCIRNETLTTHWDQTAAATGRLTSFQPNIQAIPKLPVTISGYENNFIAGKEMTDEVEFFARDAFISRPGFSFVAADFQQIELRLLAHLTDDPVLLQNFNDTSNPDIFNVLTAQWLGKAVDEVSSSEREQTKRVVYSVMYGAGKEKLAEYLKTSAENAKAIMNSFLAKVPSVSWFTKTCVEFCRKHGYTTTIFKRRRLFPNINHKSSWLRAQAERQCVNFCIQGSAADICKAAMIQLENSLYSNGTLNAQLLVQIHDELLLEVADENINGLIGVIQDVMQSHEALGGTMVKLKVRLPVSVSVGKTWGQMRVREDV